MSKHILLDTRVQNLQYSGPWSHLSTKEKNYAYFMSKASWAGAKMVPFQISYESPVIFALFQYYFKSKDFFALEQLARKAGASEDDWKQFIAYAGGFYGNMSNYHNFGAMKFVPNLNQDVFRAIIYSAHETMDQEEADNYKKWLDSFYPRFEKEIFEMEKPYTQLNFPHEGGVTGYFSSNMTPEDLELVRDFLKEQKVDVLNTRAFKMEDGSFEVTVGSIDTSASKSVEFKGKQFKLLYGEFSPFLKEMVGYLEQALQYVANDNQKVMLEKYIEHYKNGNIDTHKDSQRAWIKDQGPVVESNMGWIETYIDPENIRAYFEGWVAIVDKEKSRKFKKLVENSVKIIPQLPWPKEMEKDQFLAPDFTTLEIICFATNGCPLGINIPNYDDIRDNEGFKNLFLNNSLGSYAINAVQFATPEQSKILAENTIRCYEVHVACHELLGHGVGKLTMRNADGTASKFVDPVNGEEFESCYEQGDTWNERFGAISTSYEECRADTCGFYLAALPDVYTLFGFEEHEVDTMLWCNVMNQFRKGVLGLQLFNAETKKWGQAHTQGAYVFTQYLYQNQQSKIVDFEITEEGDFFIHLDKKNLMEEGRELIRKFLIILQTYKSSGCVERGQKFYDHYSQVNEYFLKVRDIVINKKKPRRVELNNNLVRYNEELIEPMTYPESFEGIILSYADRYPFTQNYLNDVMREWTTRADNLRVKL